MTRQPSAAAEGQFWALVDAAWADGARGEDGLPAFLTNLAALSAGFSSAELTDLDRVVERKLYDLDRAELHEVTEGGDDGFLYARGFIVAMGRDFYETVRADPERAPVDVECEELCYFFAHLHERRFGDWPDTGSGISRETGSNAGGWG